MRKANILYIITAILILMNAEVLHSQQPGWTIRNTYLSYTAVDVIPNSTVGYICGEKGFVRKTTDGGNSWELLHIGINTYLKDIKFINENTGWVISYENNLYKTINGGKNWQLHYTDTSAFQCIDFINGTTGFIGLYFGAILKTTNGGNNWVYTNLNTRWPVYDINIVSSSEIWLGSGYDTIVYSSNTGQTWQKIRTSNQTVSQSAFFVNSNTGWIAGNGLLKTTNSGNNWFSQLTLSSLGHKVYFINDNTGWVYGQYTSVWAQYYATTNAGNNWIFNYNTNHAQITSMDFSNSDFGIAAGSNGAIVTITNGGNNWDNSHSTWNKWYRGIDFVNQNTGFISYGDSTIIKTTNGGKGWRRLNLSPNKGLLDISFFDNNNGYLSGYRLLFTSDAGETWNARNTPDSTRFWKMFFWNNITGWALRFSDTVDIVYKTTDGGFNWVSQNLNAVEFPLYIYFVNSNLGFIACNGGTIYRTNNGGNSWTKILTGTFHDIFCVEFLNENTGWATGFWGPIYKTTNGGINWHSQIDPTFNHMFDIEIRSENDVWIGGDDEIVRTTNGGANWVELNTPHYLDVYSMYFFNDSSFIAVGDNSTILSNNNWGQSVGISNITSIIPSGFTLHQNYPNPFNPSTKIKFEIPKASLVRLTVYDILGRQVAELVNQNLNAGTFEYEWSATELSSGIYFYKLEAGDFVETKRMVLVK